MVMCFTPINDRIAIIRLHATPFNISIIQVYAPTTDHTDDEIFYNELQNSISKMSKKDIMVIQCDMNANIGKDAHTNWGSTSGIFLNSVTNERGYRLLEFYIYDILLFIVTLFIIVQLKQALFELVDKLLDTL